MLDTYSVKQQIFNEIENASKIILTRHKRPDGDAVGSTIGFREILRATFPEKDVRVINEDYGEYTAFIGDEDLLQEGDFYSDALVIVLDTADIGRVSNHSINYSRKIIKIDHHIDLEPFGAIAWVEPDRSSVCEMIVDFYLSFKTKLLLPSSAAYALYAGMITDSGRFYYDSTSGDTLRLAGVLLDAGIDTDRLLSNLYMESPDFYHYKAYIYDHIKYTENGVAYLYADNAMQKTFNLTKEQAASSVDFLGKIKGSLIWIAFIEYEDAIRVRLRSRYVTVSELANKYHGGGHARAAGSTVYSIAEMEKLISDADVLLKDYKTNHTDWI